MTTCYKVLAEDGSPCHGGNGMWALPSAAEPGAWMPPIVGSLRPCEHGYHLCEGTDDLVHWLGPVIYTAEYRGERLRHENKVVVREARLLARSKHWNERTARLFAAACAWDVLHLYETDYPGDSRIRECIVAAERFARGEIDRVVLDRVRAAAWAAARDAAWDAARAAAWAAARAKQSRRLAHLLATGDVLQEIPDA